MQNIAQRLLDQKSGLVFLSAPTNGGKTELIQSIKDSKPETIIISAEQFLEAVLQPFQTNGQTDSLDRLTEHNYICIEDIDWYGNREYTGYAFAKALSQLAEKSTVVVTGIDLKNRMKAMFSKLQQFDYFEKVDTTAAWM